MNGKGITVMHSRQVMRIAMTILFATVATAISLFAGEAVLPEPPQVDPVLVLQKGKDIEAGEFKILKSGATPKQQTRAKLRWNDKMLSVSCECVDSAILASQKGRDNIKLWRDDSVYLWLAPAHAHRSKSGHIMIQVSAGGLVLDQRDGKAEFNAEGMQVKVARKAGGWTARIDLPWKALGLNAPKPGDVWGFNLTRMDQPGKVDHKRMVMSSLIASADGNLMRYDRWGHLIFSTDGKLAEIAAGKAAMEKSHQVRIDVLGGQYYRDCLQLKKEKEAQEARKGLPANPQANEDVYKLLEYLTRLPERKDNRFLLAQDIWSYEGRMTGGFDRFVGKLQKKTGKWLPMIHVSYGDPTIKSKKYPGIPQEANKHAIAYWKAGGLVTIHINPNNPWTGKSYGKDNLAGREKIANVLKPGMPENLVWIEKLDAYAKLLAELRNAGVVVLWRPLHEMTFTNCYWYDCGATSDREVFKKLWRHMFRYFTYEKKLDNLIWVFSVSNVGEWGGPSPKSVYPGADYVDIVGLSLYSNEVEIHPRDYEELSSLGKPFAFTEFGPGHKDNKTGEGFDNMDLIRAVRWKYPKTIYANYWHSWHGANMSIIDNGNADRLMNDPWSVDRSELSWRQLKIDLQRRRNRVVRHEKFQFRK